MPGWDSGISFPDVPGFVDSSYDDGQAQMGGPVQAGTDTTVTLQAAGIMIVLALAALWGLAYWFRKG